MAIIHKEGRSSIILALAFAISISFIARLWIPILIIDYILYALAVFVVVIILQFFRNPKRKTVLNDNHIIAPADGKVVVIEEVEENEFIAEKRTQISIFMSPLNVHVNRYPVSGTVKYFKYHPGKFLVAWHPKSSTLNERTTIAVEDKHKNIILLKQIAGAVARRIVYYCKENEEVTQGTDCGFIKFGSRVDILLPLDMKINVKIGDKVKGGKTIIATIFKS